MSSSVQADEAGLLDVEERKVKVDLSRDDQAAQVYPPGTFRRAVWAMVGVIAALATTYAVPALHWARPWTPEMDYVPFWNLIGRELLDRGQAAEAADAEVKQALAIARAEVEKEDAPEATFKEVEVRAPVQEDEKVPPLAPHEDDAQPVEMPLERPEALDDFYAALTRTHLGLPGAITRAMHYGEDRKSVV